MARPSEYLLDKENQMELEEPAAKRRSMLEGSTSRRHHLMQFAKGSVTRVRVHNFMTYSDATFEPGARLNLVLGPNGTGKSSLVCALCLGLAGGTKLLGRGDNSKEFIQRGKSEGWVEVSLSRGDGTEAVVRRDIKRFRDPVDGRDKARSDWRINGVQKLMKDVTELMSQLNVQLDNLCQFLPQDKVVEFAKLNPCELLAETEKAIGDSTLYTLHQDLIRKRGELKEASQGTDQKKRQLEKLQQEQARQQHEYERLQRRAALLEEVELLKKKVLLLEVEGAKAEAAEVRKLYHAADLLLKQQRANMRSAEGPVQKFKDADKRLHASITSINNTLKSLKTDASNADNQASNLDTMINAKTREVGDLQRLSDERKEKIAEARRQLAKVQAEVAQVPQHAPPEEQAELRSLQQQLTAVNNQLVELDMKASERDNQVRDHQDAIHMHTGRLQQITDITKQRLRMLEARNRGVTQAHQWVCDNRARFHGQVYGPVAVEVQVADAQHSAYLKMAVPGWLWTAFIVMHKDDQLLLSQAVKQHKWDVSVTHYDAPNYNTPITHPDGEPHTLAHLDISATLDQVIKAPMVVAKVLDDQCSLSRAYIGTQRTASVMDQVEAAGVKTVYTPELRYRFMRSKYNPNAVSGRQEPTCGPLEVLQGQVDAAQVADLKAQIEAAEQAKQAAVDEAQHLRQQQEQLRAQLRVLEDRKHALLALNSARVSKLKQLTTAIRKHTTVLEMHERQPDPLERREQIHAELHELAGQYFSKYQVMVQNLKSQCIKTRDLAAAEVQAGELRALLEQARSATEGMAQQLRQTEAGFRQLTEQLTAKKADYERLRAKAEERGLLDPGVLERVQAVAGNREELEAQVAAKRAEADAIAAGDPSVLAKYQERAARIVALEVEVGDEEGEHARRQAAIDAVKARWLPDLQRMVEKINATFSRNFEEMGCAGEVTLQAHEDYDKYAIQIRVKFRASEDLQVLTAHRQSGGERSVSTILYLIALQDVTVTPFRVVDEINQGMDPINERKVYTQLVEASTRDNTPQCFLLTPKLLPDLPYTDKITVLEIFNGREIDSSINASDMDALMFGTRHRAIPA